jgi:hypothetical protein
LRSQRLDAGALPDFLAKLCSNLATPHETWQRMRGDRRMLERKGWEFDLPEADIAMDCFETHITAP